MCAVYVSSCVSLSSHVLLPPWCSISQKAAWHIGDWCVPLGHIKGYFSPVLCGWFDTVTLDYVCERVHFDNFFDMYIYAWIPSLCVFVFTRGCLSGQIYFDVVGSRTGPTPPVINELSRRRSHHWQRVVANDWQESIAWSYEAAAGQSYNSIETNAFSYWDEILMSEVLM